MAALVKGQSGNPSGRPPQASMAAVSMEFGTANGGKRHKQLAKVLWGRPLEGVFVVIKLLSNALASLTIASRFKSTAAGCKTCLPGWLRESQVQMWELIPSIADRGSNIATLLDRRFESPCGDDSDWGTHNLKRLLIGWSTARRPEWTGF